MNEKELKENSENKEKKEVNENDKEASTTVQNHQCSICGDKASGIHYKVPSCDGCRGFFKRSVRKDIQEACRYEKKCLINKQTRTSCKACRFNKCLESGMDKTAVQPFRNKKIQEETKQNDCEIRKYSDNVRRVHNSICMHSKPDNAITTNNQVFEEVYNEMNRNMAMIKNPPNNEWRKIAKQTLNMLIKWTVNLKVVQSINNYERSVLLEDNWPLVFTITLCQFYEFGQVLHLISVLFYKHQSEAALQITSTSKSDEPMKQEPFISVGTYDLTNILNRIKDITYYFQNINLDNEEYALIKIMALYYPGTEDIKFWTPVAYSYKLAITALINYIKQSKNPINGSADLSNKLSTVLMMIASIKGVNTKKFEQTFQPAFEISQPMDRVFWNSIMHNNFL